jgi:drug/metabolite transporter (DMT)-like permease
MSHRTKLLAAFAAVYVIWGSTYLAIRFTVETIPPFLMAGVRFVVAGGVLYAFMRWRGTAKPTRVEWGAAAVVGAFLLLGGNGAVVWAALRVPSGLIALIVATEPLWVVLVDWARPGGAPPRAGEALGLGLGFAGVAVLVVPAELIGGAFEIDLFGAALVVFAALSWAVGSVYSRHAPLHESRLLATAMKMLTGGALLLIAGTVSGEWPAVAWSAISLKSLLALIYLIVFGALIGFTAYVWLLGNTSLARASTYAYVNPVIAVLLGWLLAAEPMTPRIGFASAVIVASVVIVVRSRARKLESGA